MKKTIIALSVMLSTLSANAASLTYTCSSTQTAKKKSITLTLNSRYSAQVTGVKNGKAEIQYGYNSAYIIDRSSDIVVLEIPLEMFEGVDSSETVYDSHMPMLCIRSK